jgi:hypothetical protein
MGNCPNTDILCSNTSGTKFAHIQVKTFVPGSATWSVGRKAELDYGDSFFLVLGGIPAPENDKLFVYYVIPSPVMAREVRAAHELWLKTPGMNGQPHSPTTNVRTVHLPPRKNRSGWSIAEYENRWNLSTGCNSGETDRRGDKRRGRHH